MKFKNRIRLKLMVPLLATFGVLSVFFQNASGPDLMNYYNAANNKITFQFGNPGPNGAAATTNTLPDGRQVVIIAPQVADADLVSIITHEAQHASSSLNDGPLNFQIEGIPIYQKDNNTPDPLYTGNFDGSEVLAFHAQEINKVALYNNLAAQAPGRLLKLDYSNSKYIQFYTSIFNLVDTFNYLLSFNGAADSLINTGTATIAGNHVLTLNIFSNGRVGLSHSYANGAPQKLTLGKALASNVNSVANRQTALAQISSKLVAAAYSLKFLNPNSTNGLRLQALNNSALAAARATAQANTNAGKGGSQSSDRQTFSRSFGNSPSFNIPSGINVVYPDRTLWKTATITTSNFVNVQTGEVLAPGGTISGPVNPDTGQITGEITGGGSGGGSPPLAMSDLD